MIKNGKKYLVTTEHWFFAPDGLQYRSAYGVCTMKTTEEMFNFTPSRPSTNWFLEIGEGENSIIVAGCQIHYAVQCNNRPEKLEGTYQSDGKTHPNNRIFFTEVE